MAWRDAGRREALFEFDDVKHHIPLSRSTDACTCTSQTIKGGAFELKSWPNLTYRWSTEVGGGAGGYYSQDRTPTSSSTRIFGSSPCRRDMPGHMNAALASYPDLNCTALYSGIEVGFSTLCVEKEDTYRFITDVVRSNSGALTPGPYFHVGGDEVQKLTSEQFVRFIERVQSIVEAQGKTVVGWETSPRQTSRRPSCSTGARRLPTWPRHVVCG